MPGRSGAESHAHPLANNPAAKGASASLLLLMKQQLVKHRLLHAVGKRVPFVNRDRRLQTAIAVGRPVRFRTAVAIQKLTPPVRVWRSLFGNLLR